MLCPKCKSPIEDNSTECEWCGAVLNIKKTSCPKCKNSIKEDAVTCEWCGHKIKDIEKEDETNYGSTSWSEIGITILIFITFISLVAIIGAIIGAIIPQ